MLFTQPKPLTKEKGKKQLLKNIMLLYGSTSRSSVIDSSIIQATTTETHKTTRREKKQPFPVAPEKFGRGMTAPISFGSYWLFPIWRYDRSYEEVVTKNLAPLLRRSGQRK
ncbi:hypothetical protein AVEN_17621-1 [Araneus ventricosus]|uniref:Uncharacterized protein n=1 Tax=Araneus ventricosus TaxID=182803 RepID=A0A4Y2J3K0_ARAVE|nr:hypothetical protein AVEN_17621-1 [Araneus ventricosus]